MDNAETSGNILTKPLQLPCPIGLATKREKTKE